MGFIIHFVISKIWIKKKMVSDGQPLKNDKKNDLPTTAKKS
jgi:hypothetical protein